jgi:protein SCO1/2
MFYATCPAACPTLVADIKAIERRLSPSERAQLRVLLVSFDAERDTPAVLDALAAKHGIDRSRWRFTSAAEADARALAAVLGVQYRKTADGQFTHSAAITLLDGDGAIVEQLDGLGVSSDPLVARVRAVAIALSVEDLDKNRRP